MSDVHRRLRSTTCIVTYRKRHHVRVILGDGDTIEERIRDADARLPRGRWTRLSVSTPSTIYTDLTHDTHPHHKLPHTAYENQVVVVP